MKSFTEFLSNASTDLSESKQQELLESFKSQNSHIDLSHTNHKLNGFDINLNMKFNGQDTPDMGARAMSKGSAVRPRITMSSGNFTNSTQFESWYKTGVLALDTVSKLQSVLNRLIDKPIKEVFEELDKYEADLDKFRADIEVDGVPRNAYERMVKAYS